VSQPIEPVIAQTAARGSPLVWVGTSYFARGLIYATVGSMANVMFKNMGMDNDRAAFWSSLIGLPYSIKPLWAPLLEIYKTKTFFIVLMQFLLAGLLAGVALALKLPGAAFFAGPVIALLAIAALAGATQDIGSDGVFVTTLNARAQAKYTGPQGMFWQMGPILATGVLVRASGMLHERSGDWGISWMIIMLIIGGVMLGMGLLHSRLLPRGAKAQDAPKNAGDAIRTFGRAFSTFFGKRGIVAMIAFAFLYRCGMGLLDKMGPLFMIDSRAHGGLGLSNQILGDINGTFGTGAFIVGSLLGGVIVSKRGLKRSLVVLCLCLNLPNATYLYLSWSRIDDPYVITTIVTLQKLGWGFGSVGYMIYMMQQIAPGPYKTAHYSFATALLGLCLMTTGMASGYIQKIVGYQWFFVVVMIAAIPSLLVTLTAPYHHEDVTGPPEPSRV
jgi:PAT family beta-lactamase induction signal transducer AmpG